MFSLINKRCWLAILLVLAGLGPLIGAVGVTAPAARPADNGGNAAIHAVLTDQVAAWNRGDVSVFLTGYWNSPDLTFAGSAGIVRGYAGLMERYRKSYPDRAAMGQLDFSSLEIRSLGPDASLVLGHWHLKRSSGEIGGVFSLVFQRFDSGWRIVHDHTSQVDIQK